MTLRAGTTSVDIVGEELLTVSSLRHHGAELLMDAAELPAGYRVHDRRAGITLLHPWANRLSADRYGFDGKRGQLGEGAKRITRDANGLAIHGITAPQPWRIDQAGPRAAEASLTWAAEPGFPFAHQITVSLDLNTDPTGAAALAIHTRVTALSQGAVPIAFGWHPYFRRHDAGETDRAEIDLPALSRLGADERGLPTGLSVPQPASRLTLAGQHLDFGVSGLTPGSRMELRDSHRTITVEVGEGYPYGQVFAPHDAPVVSLEPMTAPTDALSRGTDLRVADPEHPYTAAFVVRVR